VAIMILSEFYLPGGFSMLVNKVEICGVNTSKLPVLTNDQKKVLFERMHKGDTTAREEFIRGNLRLVLSVIQRFNNGVNM
jgi:RNA polymerase sporulation-specific sigma factor